MSIKNLFIMFCCLWGYMQGIAQDAITLIERDQDGAYVNAKGAVKEVYINPRLIDINSIIDIKLNYDVITARISEIEGIGLPKEFADKIEALTTAMKARNENLKSFNKLLDTYDYELFKKHPEMNKEWAAKMQGVVSSIMGLVAIDPYISEGESFRPRILYQRTATVLEQMEAKLKDVAKENGIGIRFGAWLVAERQNIPLHLPGFDAIAPQTPFEVERWQIIPTEEQIQQFRTLQQYAQENKDNCNEMLKKMLKNEVLQLQEFAQHEFANQIASFRSEIQQLKRKGITPITTDLSILEEDVVSLKNQLIQRVSYFQGLGSNTPEDPFDIVSRIGTDISFLKNGIILKIKADFENLLTTIQEQPRVIRSEIKDTEVRIQNLKQQYESWYSHLESMFNQPGLLNILGGVVIDTKSLEFSDQVQSFSLDDLPRETTLDLLTTGRRKEGDQIAFKLEIKKQEEIVYDDNKVIGMYKILPHIEGTVGVVFADPLAHTAVKTQFQMAPYYNMLLKGVFDQQLRRRSVLYNKLFDMGIGLHVSAPDFDGDDIPELGTGIVVSMLSDYVQSGMAINVFTGDPYWFFGVKLPVPSFNIGNL